MSKTLFVAVLLAAVGLGACNKEEVDPNIPANYVETGAIKYQNNSGDLYDIYLDDTRYGSLYGGASSVYPQIATGQHRVKAVQVEHISGTPTLRQMTVFVQKDSTVTFAFP